MEVLVLRTELKIFPGRSEEFREAASEWVADTQREEATLAFDAYFDELNLRAVFLESFAGSAGFLAHLASVDLDRREKLYRTCEVIGLDVHGDPSPAVREALAFVHPRYLAPLASKHVSA